MGLSRVLAFIIVYTVIVAMLIGVTYIFYLAKMLDVLLVFVCIVIPFIWALDKITG